jgi:hypothetical protein
MRTDPAALKGLHTVDWSTVSHAHGPAIDIPSLFRALVSDNSDHRNFACQLLFETIWHQGCVYEATAPVVPVLYELLATEGPQDKAAIAHLLATIADGSPAFAGRSSAQAIHKELARRLELLFPYLRNPDSGLRYSIAVAFRSFPETAVQLLPPLQAALREETDRDVRTAIEDTIDRLSQLD